MNTTKLLCTVSGLLSLTPTLADFTISPGDILATSDFIGVECIDPQSGAVNNLLSFGLNTLTLGLAISPTGDIFVGFRDQSGQSWIKGFQLQDGGAPTLIADIPTTNISRALTFTSDGRLFGLFATSGGPVFEVDLQADQVRTVAQGGLLLAPFDLKGEISGHLIISDSARVLRFDPATSSLSLLSSGGLLQSSQGIAVNHQTGDIFVLDQVPDNLVRVDSVSGAQTLVFHDHIFNTERTIASNDDGLFYIDSPLSELNLASRTIRSLPANVENIDQLAIWNRAATLVAPELRITNLLLCGLCIFFSGRKRMHRRAAAEMWPELAETISSSSGTSHAQ
jgi:hypothetical protein